MKMKKLIVVIVCLAMIAITFVSCSGNSKVQLQYNEPYEKLYKAKNEEDYSITEVLSFEKISSTHASKDVQDEVNKLEKDIISFINNSYGLKWKSKKIEVYYADFQNNLSSYAAMADPKMGRIYIDNKIYDSEVKYRIAHELIHMIRYNNVGSYQFVRANNNDQIIGYYVGESLTDLITSKYFEYKGDNQVYDFFLNNSQYCYTMVALKALEYSIPNMCYYYLEDTPAIFEDEFNCLASSSVKSNTKENHFENFCNYADYIVTIPIQLGSNIAPIYKQIMLNSIFGNFELVTAISKDRAKASNEIAYIFELEGGQKNEVINNFIKYLKTL